MIQPTAPVAPDPPLTPRPASDYCMVLKRDLRELIDWWINPDATQVSDELLTRMEALADE